MDVLRLDKETYLADELIENYNSMVWTERFGPMGEFEMKTSDIENTLELIPENSLITLLDSDEIAIVVTHSIGVNDDGIPIMTTKGKTFERIFFDRAIGLSEDPPEVMETLTAGAAAKALIERSIVSTSIEEDKYPNLGVTLTRTDALTYDWPAAPIGDLYSALDDVLNKGYLGIRNIRPIQSTDPEKNRDSLAIDIYKGVDRTYKPGRWWTTSEGDGIPVSPNMDAVVFRYDTGDITDTSYLFSSHTDKNVAYVYSSAGLFAMVYAPGVSPSVSGLDRRVLQVETSIDDELLLVQKGLIELAKNNHVSIFEGVISPLAEYKYKEHYDLGDFVTLQGEYGFSADMRVSEYVRVHDQEGERAYPSLELPPIEEPPEEL